MKLDPLALRWRKSSYSGPNGPECVEVAEARGGVAVRDSKNPQGPVHLFGRAAFRALARGLRASR